MADRYTPRQARPRLLQGRSSATCDAAPRAYRPFIPPGQAGTRKAVHRLDRGEHGKLLAYACGIVLVSALTEPIWLIVALCGVLLLAGRKAWSLLRRAILATLTFSIVVSLAYVLQVLWLLGAIPWQWLLTINLRVLDMALLTFVFIERTNLFTALSFSRRLTFMLVLAVSQSLGLRRTLEDFRLAMQSRSARRIGLRDRYRAAGHAAGWLLDRALANAHESAQALQARGMFR
jgi:cobalt/nickel transport system permease protein